MAHSGVRIMGQFLACWEVDCQNNGSEGGVWFVDFWRTQSCGADELGVESSVAGKENSIEKKKMKFLAYVHET